MKKISLLFLSLLFLATMAYSQDSQDKKPVSPRVTAEGKNVKVAYGQPSKKGREIFGKLEPYGKVWRTGANEATEITFAKDTKFGGKDVKAGTYTLFTIPDEKKWTVILNSELGQWGAYKHDTSKDVVKVEVPVKKLKDVTEKLTIQVDEQNANKANLNIAWDQTQVSVPMVY